MRRQLPLPWCASAEPRADANANATARPAALQVASPLFVRNGRARRYILRVLPDETVRVTIPRYGSRREAEAFMRTRLAWIAARQHELRERAADRRWQPGTLVWWRGREEQLAIESNGDADTVVVRVGELAVRTRRDDDYRAVVERAMRRAAVLELPAQLLALAAQHDLPVAAVSVRSQRSRWGSCSRAGRVALNWRLLQMPEPVRVYVLLHELMHIREPNHSPRFWALVDAVCPAHRESRAWLRREGLALC